MKYIWYSPKKSKYPLYLRMTLRKHCMYSSGTGKHYENLSMQYIEFSEAVKIENFATKLFDKFEFFFFFLLKTLNVGTR